MRRCSPRGRAQTWTEDPTPRLPNQGCRSRRGRRAALTQRKRNWDPKPGRPRTQVLRRSACRCWQARVDHKVVTCGWLSRRRPASRAPAAPRGRAGTQGTGSGHAPPALSLSSLVVADVHTWDMGPLALACAARCCCLLAGRRSSAARRWCWWCRFFCLLLRLLRPAQPTPAPHATPLLYLSPDV
jgi:hypothetical protein